MQIAKSVAAMALTGVLVAACGGAGAPTQEPGGGGGGAATQAPAATQGGGGGGGGGGNTGGGSGQIHIEIGGPAQAVVDEPFFAFGSRFGGDAGVALNFTSDGANGAATVSAVGDEWTITWIGQDLVANSSTCNRSNWNFGATSASGTFDCTGGFATKPDGTYLTGVTMKGSFSASQ